MKDLWMVRTQSNRIEGPFGRAELIREIERGTWTAQDEICRAESYWFFLHESEELFRHLQMTLPRASTGEEDTDTETQQTIQLNPSAASTRSKQSPESAAGSDRLPSELEIEPIAAESSMNATGVYSRSSQHESEQRASRGSHGEVHGLKDQRAPHQSTRSVESPFLLQVLVWVLSAIALGTLYFVMRVLMRS